MTKKLYSAALAGTAVLAFSLSATSAHAATASATANAQIVEAIEIEEDAQLDFAVIVPGAALSTVQVSPAGVRTCGAGLTCSGTAAAGAFTATGTDGYTVGIDVDATTTLSNGTDSMDVNGLTASAATATLTGGSATFTVGGTLEVGANQAAGVYTGNYDVSVNYQ